MRTLENTIALVTGASSGLGYEFALTGRAKGRRFRGGAQCRQVDRSGGRGRKQGGRAMVFSFDAVDPAAPDNWIDAVAERMGVPAILINNAELSLTARANKATLDDFEQTMPVNVRASWRLSQLCAARWIEAETQSCIVNISSMLSASVAKGCVAVHHLKSDDPALKSGPRAGMGETWHSGQCAVPGLYPHLDQRCFLGNRSGLRRTGQTAGPGLIYASVSD
ncbi:SDR family oxidoreductase [Salipiger sp. 1_MG-2023]|nr:SDR family oxidoreductase [Salipiger sp. 1_MG-2023]MDO6588173.1 SDR family oxidoreductase [Salipiger sp. 1_MG-2023]